MPALKWTYDKLAEEALKYTTKVEFSKANASAYVIAKRKGILDEICSHMVCGRTKWTLDAIQKEALKYNTRKKFSVESRSAYDAAIRTGVINKVCSHMTPHHISWTPELVSLSAKNYNTRRSFKIGDEKAYSAAHRLGIIDSVCSHMKSPVGSWKNKPLPDFKVCDDCDENLPLSDFEKSPAGVYYVSNVCNKCYYLRRKEQSDENPTLKLSRSIRTLINFSFKNYSKKTKTEDILGCSIKVFREYIESQFDEKMSWDNYGRNGWHLDHKVPISLAQNEKDVYKLNHYINFQPLWESDNIYKRDKLLPEFEELKKQLLNDTEGSDKIRILNGKNN